MAKKQNNFRLQVYYLGVITILLILTSYLLWDKLSGNSDEEKLELAQQAAQIGYQQAIIEVMQATADCQQVPLVAGETTIIIKDITCS